LNNEFPVSVIIKVFDRIPPSDFLLFVCAKDFAKPIFEAFIEAPLPLVLLIPGRLCTKLIFEIELTLGNNSNLLEVLVELDENLFLSRIELDMVPLLKRSEG
ncbi:hypothetical protein B9K06_26190, partial [Bacillus sp. OG2]